MKLEHLMQSYKLNKIEAELNEINTETKKTGTIKFAKGITAAYLLDDEEIVTNIKIFFNCLTQDSLNINTQLSYTIKILNIIQNTIELIGNIPQKEINMILDSLGMFDGTFINGKQIKHLEHEYKVEVIDGLLCFNINEL